jgi:flavin reductase (DIM6/NTAB) family NADH-FMN oxidoreductase RutF
MVAEEPAGPGLATRLRGMELSPADLSQPDRYKLLIGGVVPRPIAFVSTISPGGKLNLAPFSFFCAVGSSPMTMLFCPANKPDGGEKDSLINARSVADGGMGEFVVNIASESISRQVAGAAEPLPHGESEFSLVGLTPSPSRLVKPPRVLEAPISYECRTIQVIRTGPGVPAAGNIVLGEVLHIWVRGDLINDRFHIDPAKLDAIGRMGGLEYCRTRDRFSLPMGVRALEG